MQELEFETELTADLLELDELSMGLDYLSDLQATDLRDVRPELLSLTNETVLGSDVVGLLQLGDTAGLEFLGKVKDGLVAFWRAVVDFIKGMFKKIAQFFGFMKDNNVKSAKAKVKADSDKLDAIASRVVEGADEAVKAEIKEFSETAKTSLKKITEKKIETVEDAVEQEAQVTDMAIAFEKALTKTKSTPVVKKELAKVRKLTAESTVYRFEDNKAFPGIFYYKDMKQITDATERADVFIDKAMSARAEYYSELIDTVISMSGYEDADMISKGDAAKAVKDLDKQLTFNKYVKSFEGVSVSLSQTVATFVGRTSFEYPVYELEIIKEPVPVAGTFTSPKNTLKASHKLIKTTDAWKKSDALKDMKKVVEKLDSKSDKFTDGLAAINGLIKHSDLTKEQKKGALAVKSATAKFKSGLTNDLNLIFTLASNVSRIFGALSKLKEEPAM